MSVAIIEKQFELIKARSKIKLDIGCGQNKKSGWVGMDVRPWDGVDIVHDLEMFPWPLPDDCASVILASHVLEHVPKVGYALESGKLVKRFPLMELFDEAWRVLEPGGQFQITVPYAGSHGFAQDPTHASPINETLFEYFDPDFALWHIYKPKPWKVAVRQYELAGNMFACLEARK